MGARSTSKQKQKTTVPQQQKFVHKAKVKPISKKKRVAAARQKARENTVEHIKEINLITNEIKVLNRYLAPNSRANPRHRATYSMRIARLQKKLEAIRGLKDNITEATFFENNLSAIEAVISRSHRKDDPNRSLAEWRPYYIYENPTTGDLTVHIEQNNTIKTPGVFHRQVTTTSEKRVTANDLHGATNTVKKTMDNVPIIIEYTDTEEEPTANEHRQVIPILIDGKNIPYGYLVIENSVYKLYFHSLTRGLTVAETKACIVAFNQLYQKQQIQGVLLVELKKVLFSNKFTLDQNHFFQQAKLNEYRQWFAGKFVINRSRTPGPAFGMMHVTNGELLSQVVSEFSVQYFEFKKTGEKNVLLNGGVRANAINKALLTGTSPLVGTDGVPLEHQPGNISCSVAEGIISLGMDRAFIVNGYCGCPHLDEKTGILCNNSGRVFHLPCNGTLLERQQRCRKAINSAIASAGKDLPLLLQIGDRIFNNDNQTVDFVTQCLRYMDFIHDFATVGRDFPGFENEIECSSILQHVVNEARVAYASTPNIFAISPEKLFIEDFLLTKYKTERISMGRLAHDGDDLFGFLIRSEEVSKDTEVTNQEGLIEWLIVNYPKHILAPDVLNIRKNGISREYQERILTLFSGESLKYDLGHGPAGLVTYIQWPPVPS